MRLMSCLSAAGRAMLPGHGSRGFKIIIAQSSNGPKRSKQRMRSSVKPFAGPGATPMTSVIFSSCIRAIAFHTASCEAGLVNGFAEVHVAAAVPSAVSGAGEIHRSESVQLAAENPRANSHLAENGPRLASRSDGFQPSSLIGILPERLAGGGQYGWK